MQGINIGTYHKYQISKVYKYRYGTYRKYENYEIFHSASLISRKWLCPRIKKWSNYCKTNCQDCAISPQISRNGNARTASSITIPDHRTDMRCGCALLYRDVIFKLLTSPGIDSKDSITPVYIFEKTFKEPRNRFCQPNVACAWLFRQSMGARNRVRIGLSYRPARLQRLA